MNDSFEVILTRPPHKSYSLEQKLVQQKIPTRIIPLIKIQKCSLQPYEKIVLEQRENYQWLVFPSENAVHFFFEGLKEFQLLPKIWKNHSIITVGQHTAEVLKQYGSFFQPYIPKSQKGEALVELLEQKWHPSFQLLLIAGKQSVLVPLFQEKQMQFNWVQTYETQLIFPVSPKTLQFHKQIWVFASPSAVKSFMQKASLTDVLATVAIGTTTAKAIQQYDSKVPYIASEPSEKGLLIAIQNVIREYGLMR